MVVRRPRDRLFPVVADVKPDAIFPAVENVYCGKALRPETPCINAA